MPLVSLSVHRGETVDVTHVRRLFSFGGFEEEMHTEEDQPGDVHVTIRMRCFGVEASIVSSMMRGLLDSIFHPIDARVGIDNIDVHVTDKRVEFVE